MANQKLVYFSEEWSNSIGEKKPKEWYMTLDLKSPFSIHICLPVLACHCQKVFVYAELRHILVMKMDV